MKNTLARKAIAGTAFECVGKSLKGPLILAFSKDDPGAAARLVKAFAKDHDKLKATVVSLGGSALTAKDLDKVASLPTKQQALSQLVGRDPGADREVRAHAGRTPREAGADHRRCAKTRRPRRRAKARPHGLETDSERQISE